MAFQLLYRLEGDGRWTVEVHVQDQPAGIAMGKDVREARRRAKQAMAAALDMDDYDVMGSRWLEFFPANLLVRA